MNAREYTGINGKSGGFTEKEREHIRERMQFLVQMDYSVKEDPLIKFAVIVSRSNGKWVFCKHKERDTFEAPGGHREPGEDIMDTAKRELYEETGAIKFSITPVCYYSVTTPDAFDGEEILGGLFFAEIESFESELHSEIESVHLMEDLPSRWTYPHIQPRLIEEVKRRKFIF